MAGLKITDLEQLSSAASDDLLYIVDVSDTSQSPDGTSKKIELEKLRGYKVYSALLTQVDSTAPTAFELENTIGEINWTYEGSGQFIAISDGKFIANKTFGICGSAFDPALPSFQPVIVDMSGSSLPNLILLRVGGGDFNGDNLLFNTAIEIRVYN